MFGIVILNALMEVAKNTVACIDILDILVVVEVQRR